MGPTLITLASLLLLTTAQNDKDVCFWDADDTSNSLGTVNRNGLYRYAGTRDGNDYYKLDRTGANCNSSGLLIDYLYMYKQIGGGDDGKWVISATPPGNNQLVYGICNAPTNTPLECGVGNTPRWIVDNKEQARARTTFPTCPEKSCTSISVSTTPNTGGVCNGGINFNQIGFNMFAANSGAAEYVWWFNPLSFQWICTNTKNGAGNAPVVSGHTDTAPDTLRGYCPEHLRVTASGSATGRKLQHANGFQGPFTGSGQGVEAGPDMNALFTFTCNGEGNGATYTKGPTTPRPTIGPTSPIPTFGSGGNGNATGAPTSNTVSPGSPTTSPNNGGDGPGTGPSSTPAPNSNAGSGGGSDDDGIAWWLWLIIILCIVLYCCCCIVLLVCLIQKKKSRKGTHTFE